MFFFQSECSAVRNASTASAWDEELQREEEKQTEADEEPIVFKRVKKVQASKEKFEEGVELKDD